jgi:hypothetical protein
MRRFLLVLLFFCAAPSFAAGEVNRAIAARETKRYAEAIVLLQKAVAEQPSDRRAWTLLGETQGWAKRFADAEESYRKALRRFPEDRTLRLGLARVLSWRGKFVEAAAEYRSLLRRDADDSEALAGAARNEHWSGDERAALRHGEQLLQQGSDDEARQIIREIKAATRPTAGFSAALVDDDQPLRRLRSELWGSLYSDPSTAWTVVAGSEAIDSDAGVSQRSSASVPFVRVGASTHAGAFVFSAEAGGIRYPDESSGFTGRVSVGRSLRPGVVVRGAVERDALLASATALDTHASVTRASLSLVLAAPSRWLGGVAANSLSYFDDNHGIDVNGYLLAPVTPKTNRFQAWLGGAASYRDTDESRFFPSSPSGGGVYDPYWTPLRLREGRLVAAAAMPALQGTLNLHADGGVARDELLLSAGAGSVDRTFHPWRLSAGYERNFAAGYALQLAVEHNVSVFYVSNEIRAGLVRRF